jgi:glycosyltransferase involved in cell wall biosynthesis
VRIDQFLPTFAANDAIGNHVLQSRRVLRQVGFDSDIWADEIHPGVRHEARHYLDYGARGRTSADALLYHASTNSRMVEFLVDRGEPLLIDYHNITPSRFFARWDLQAAASMDQARVELGRLATVTQLALAVSAYNEAELTDLGYGRTAVCPPLVDFDVFDARTKSLALERNRRDEREDRDSGPQWLFVGRIAPNKCQHDIIGAYAAYRRFFRPKARLVLVGGTTSRSYRLALERLVAELEVEDGVELGDSIPFDQLLTYYKTSDVFVCLSEHEGFCIPVLEAMRVGIPVVAYAAAAIPETVADAATLLTDKDPLIVAGAIDRVVSDATLRKRLVDAGRERVDKFSLRRTSKLLTDTLGGFLDERHACAL